MSIVTLSLNDLPNAAFILKSTGEVVELNSAFAEILGLQKDEFIGKSVYGLLNIDEAAKLKSIIENDEPNRLTKSEISFTSTKKYNYTLDLLISTLPTDKSSEPLFLVQAYNITHFKRVKDELNEQRRLYKTLVQNLPGLVYRCKPDKSWTMEYISSHCIDITGYRPEDLIDNKKLSFNDLIRPDYRDEIWEKWQKVLQEKSPFILEYPIITASGEEKWIWEQGAGVFNAKDEIVALEGIIFDITHRRKAEVALRNSEAKFRTLVENAFDGIYLMRNRRYEYANQRFVELTGYSLEELSHYSFDFKLLLTEKSVELVEQRYRDRLAGKHIPSQYELQIKSKDGLVREVELSTATIDSEGDVVVLGVMRDITERNLTQRLIKENEKKLKKQNEEYLALNEELTETNNRIVQINAELLAANQKADEHDKLKSAFLANMSHEIRTPMNGIIGFSQLLMNKDQSDDDRFEYIGIIQNCGQQLLAIINDLIDISKIEANQITLEPKRVKINDLLNEQLLLYKSRANPRGINIDVILGFSDDEIVIEVDDTRLKQVLSHLIGNAFKFTQKGSIYFGYNLKGENLEFFVRDTGIGIPHNMRDSIFERFRQVEVDLSRQAGGTGLGLSISKALVNKMGGDIWVESEPQVGSTFYFSIPFHKVSDYTIIDFVEEKRYQNIPRRANIIIAEDNEVNYMYLRQLLKGVEADLTWALNGVEVVNLVKNNPNIDLILMDIKMPIMDGYEATQVVKKIRPNLPIVAQTAYAMSGDREKATEAGCDDYISKPINREKFLQMVERLLQNKD
jgi:PAS domain S-box-containing protein